ncbi:MAG: polyhydroxyalkanoate synthesis regulator DNA-binding domain-containing protein [Gammaproteobacteria bacterium]
MRGSRSCPEPSKYANRRLYDTEASRHVTLEGIRQLVAGGEDLVVVDDTTGGYAKHPALGDFRTKSRVDGILSADMLKHLIRFYGNPLQDLMGGYLERSVEIS